MFVHGMALQGRVVLALVAARDNVTTGAVCHKWQYLTEYYSSSLTLNTSLMYKQANIQH